VGVAWDASGGGFAVRFSPPFQDCRIVKAKLYFHALNNPSDPIKVLLLVEEAGSFLDQVGRCRMELII
jgi:hypothetical protein